MSASARYQISRESGSLVFSSFASALHDDMSPLIAPRVVECSLPSTDTARFTRLDAAFGVMFVRSLRKVCASFFMVSIFSTLSRLSISALNCSEVLRITRVKGDFLHLAELFFIGSLGDLSHSFEGSSSDLVGSWNCWGSSSRVSGFWFVLVSLCRRLGAGASVSARASALGFSLFSLSFGWVFLFLTGARTHTRATLGRTIRAQRTQRTNTDKYGHVGRVNPHTRGTYIVVTCTYLRTYDFP